MLHVAILVGIAASLVAAAFAGVRLWLLSDAPDGATTKGPMPPFQKIGGIAVSFAHPGMVLVLNAIHARLSVGGAVPLLVPR